MGISSINRISMFAWPTWRCMGGSPCPQGWWLKGFANQPPLGLASRGYSVTLGDRVLEIAACFFVFGKICFFFQAKSWILSNFIIIMKSYIYIHIDDVYFLKYLYTYIYIYIQLKAPSSNSSFCPMLCWKPQIGQKPRLRAPSRVMSFPRNAAEWAAVADWAEAHTVDGVLPHSWWKVTSQKSWRLVRGPW